MVEANEKNTRRATTLRQHLMSEQEKLKQELVEAQAEAKQLKQNLETRDNELQEAIANQKQAGDVVDSEALRVELAQLKLQLEREKEANQAKTAEIEALQVFKEKSAKLEEKSQALKRDLSSEVQIKERLDKSVKELEAQVAQLTSDRSALESKLVISEANVKMLGKALEELIEDQEEKAEAEERAAEEAAQAAEEATQAADEENAAEESSEDELPEPEQPVEPEVTPKEEVEEAVKSDEETKLEDPKPEEPKPEETQPEPEPEETKPEEPNVEQPQSEPEPEVPTPEESKQEEVQTEETQPEEPTPEEAKPEPEVAKPEEPEAPVAAEEPQKAPEPQAEPTSAPQVIETPQEAQKVDEPKEPAPTPVAAESSIPATAEDVAEVAQVKKDGILTQWAWKVVDFSSEATPTDWSAKNILGAPKLSAYGSHELTWAPLETCGGHEWITLKFKRKVRITMVKILESCNPGAINLIEVLNGDKFEAIWDREPKELPHELSLIQAAPDFKIDYLSQVVKIHLDTKNIYDEWNEIAAVQLFGVPEEGVEEDESDEEEEAATGPKVDPLAMKKGKPPPPPPMTVNAIKGTAAPARKAVVATRVVSTASFGEDLLASLTEAKNILKKTDKTEERSFQKKKEDDGSNDMLAILQKRFDAFHGVGQDLNDDWDDNDADWDDAEWDDDANDRL